MNKQDQLREVIRRVAKKNRISYGEAIRLTGDMIGRSGATVKRYLSVKPDGKPYPFPDEALALAILRINGKI